MTDALLTHTVPGGAAWSVQVARGREVTLTAAGERPNASVLLFAAGDPIDRLNVPDTLKAQYSACVRPPMVLMSDRGVGLASVTGSSLHWHDALCGHGVTPPGRPSARAGLLSELRKHGRDERHLHATVNFFSKAAIDGEAGLGFVRGHAGPGDWVSLRAEVDLLLVLSTAAHPLDTDHRPADVRVEVRPTAAPGPADASRTFRPESARALDQAQAVLA